MLIGLDPNNVSHFITSGLVSLLLILCSLYFPLGIYFSGHSPHCVVVTYFGYEPRLGSVMGQSAVFYLFASMNDSECG